MRLVAACPVCSRLSYDLNAVAGGYCGRCHDWTGIAVGSPDDQPPAVTGAADTIMQIATEWWTARHPGVTTHPAVMLREWHAWTDDADGDHICGSCSDGAP